MYIIVYTGQGKSRQLPIHSLGYVLKIRRTGAEQKQMQRLSEFVASVIFCPLSPTGSTVTVIFRLLQDLRKRRRCPTHTPVRLTCGHYVLRALTASEVVRQKAVWAHLSALELEERKVEVVQMAWLHPPKLPANQACGRHGLRVAIIMATRVPSQVCSGTSELRCESRACPLPGSRGIGESEPHGLQFQAGDGEQSTGSHHQEVRSTGDRMFGEPCLPQSWRVHGAS